MEKRMNKIQFSAKILNDNFWGNIPQPKNSEIDRTCNNKNKLKIDAKKKYKDKNPINNKPNKIFEKIKLPQKKNVDKNENLIINKKVNIHDFPSENIPKEEFEMQNETEEIKEMRQSLLEELNKKNVENELKKVKKRINILEIKKDSEKGKKKIKKGNLIIIKEINPDSLMKEFETVFSSQKEIKAGTSLSNLYEEKSKMASEAVENISYNNLKENKIKKDMKKTKSKNIIKENKLNELFIRLKPSGSNFGLFQPEVGVKIKEESNMKFGGINFLEKYKKFSIQDFNRTLNKSSLQNKKEILNIKKLKTQKIDLLNNTMTLTSLSNNKEKEELNKEKYNDNIFYKTLKPEKITKKKFQKSFSNRLYNTTIRKKIIKSKSEISLNNSINSNILNEILTSKQNEENTLKNNYYIKYNESSFSNNCFDMKNSDININKIFNRKIHSPTPTYRIKSKNNSFLKINIINKMKNDYKIMDNFNRKILKGEYKDKLFQNNIQNNPKGILLPILLFKNKKLRLKNELYRTKNLFYRTRRKKINKDNNSNLL